MPFSSPLRYVVSVPTATMLELQRTSLLAAPAIWTVLALAILAGLFTAYVVHRRVVGDEAARLWTMLYVPAVVAAATFLGTVALISIGLWLLQMLGYGSLYVFGKLTDLAALTASAFAVAGSIYFMAIKFAEKRVEEALEHVLKRFFPQQP